MDKELIISMFDDMAQPVLGGVIGRRPNVFADDSHLAHAGVKTVIDLQVVSESVAEGAAECYKEYGLDFFNLPLNRKKSCFMDVDVRMVERFPRFCELVEAGDFYMYGWPEAIISLGLYWLFYAADKGVSLEDIFHVDDMSPSNSPFMRGDFLQEDDYVNSDYLNIFDGNEGILIDEVYTFADSMQAYYEENIKNALPHETLNLRENRFWGNDHVGTYSFLSFMSDSYYGHYRIKIKTGEDIGDLEEPNREHNDWKYSVSLEGNSTTGHASSFDAAKKQIFDFVFHSISPSYYLKLMGLK